MWGPVVRRGVCSGLGGGGAQAGDDRRAVLKELLGDCVAGRGVGGEGGGEEWRVNDQTYM